MEIGFRSDHGANVLCILDNPHFAKFFTVRWHPIQQLATSVAAILYPTKLPMIEIKPGNKRRRQGSRYRSERRSRHCKAISMWTRRRLEKLEEKLGPGGILWKDRVLEPPKYWVERCCKQKTTRWAALPDACSSRKMPAGFMHRKCWMNAGNSAFSRTWKMQVRVQRQNP